MAHSAETKEKIRQALLGKKHTPERIARMSKPRSTEGRKNMSVAMKGKTPWNKGKTGIYSPETIAKISKGATKPRSVESRKKQSASMTGRKQSEEHRVNNRLSQHKRFAKVIPDYAPNMKGSRRRIQARANGGFHSVGEWETCKAQYNWTCQMCLKKEPDIILTRDHIIPVSKGGTNNIENIKPLCRPCNTRKGTKLLN